MSDRGELAALVEHIHHRALFDDDYCDHGTYAGGPDHGQPYAMCERKAAALLASDWLAEHDAKVRAEALEQAVKAIEARYARIPEPVEIAARAAFATVLDIVRDLAEDADQ